MLSKNQVLSPKRYGISRVVRYITFIVLVLMFFMPILSFKETKYVFGTEVTVRESISPFQFLAGMSEVTPTVSVRGDSSASDFLESFVEEIDIFEAINPGEEFLNGNAVLFVRIGILLWGICFACFFPYNKLGRNDVFVQRSKIKPAGAKEERIVKQCIRYVGNYYISDIIWGLPRILKFIEILLSSLIFLSILAFYGMAIINGSLTPDYVLGITGIIVFFIVENHTVERIICKKDIDLIRKEKLRYEFVGEKATFASDMKAIKMIFSNNTTVEYNTHSQESNIEELYKYKKLLEDGIISEEEYQKKKNEILNFHSNRS